MDETKKLEVIDPKDGLANQEIAASQIEEMIKSKLKELEGIPDPDYLIANQLDTIFQKNKPRMLSFTDGSIVQTRLNILVDDSIDLTNSPAAEIEIMYLDDYILEKTTWTFTFFNMQDDCSGLDYKRVFTLATSRGEDGVLTFYVLQDTIDPRLILRKELMKDPFSVVAFLAREVNLLREGEQFTFSAAQSMKERVHSSPIYENLH